MFENLTGRLSDAAKQLSGKGRLTEANIKDTLRQVRLALLEADVHVQVARKFCDDCLEQALGMKVIETLKQRGEQLRRRLYDVGIQSEPVLVIVGEKRR